MIQIKPLEQNTSKFITFMKLNQMPDVNLDQAAAVDVKSIDVDLALIASSRLLDDLTTLASKAAAAILALDRSALTQRIKSDLSPVTAADDVAQSVILETLPRLLPGIPIVSEEAGGAAQKIDCGTTFILVDPLDGTREYLAGRDEFTVNIAIVSRGRPAVGCIAAPMHGLMWRGIVGHGAERLELPMGSDASACQRRTKICTRQAPEQDMIVAISRSHFEAETEHFLRHFPRARRAPCGSSLKFCRIAEGSTDLYPRLAPTHEWDIAAGHAILAAAGGTVVTPTGEPLCYGRSEDNFLVSGFVAIGDCVAAERLLQFAHSN
ncbi:MAG TPA: 3'(2'),5'-bisphosphate nucleotidase CysQ [Xanthobacteraceae bacterium]|nr:3'(2'),5'-bisphosphate nucleotidase CysQ [Xanthobacteraceae bacterium]